MIPTIYDLKFLLNLFMAKRSMILREKKRQKLVKRYLPRRTLLKKQILLATTYDEKLRIHGLLQKLPLNSSPTRLHNRCFLTGRPKGYYRFFGLSRHMLRKLAHQGALAGVKKASW